MHGREGERERGRKEGREEVGGREREREREKERIFRSIPKPQLIRFMTLGSDR